MPIKAFLAFIATLLAAAPVLEARDRGKPSMANIYALGGVKFLDDEWTPAEDQRAFGAQFDVRPEDWPVHLAAGFIYGDSTSEQANVPGLGVVTSESTTVEFDLGFRGYLENEYIRPFLGAGLAVVRGESETEAPTGSDSDSGTGLGFWVGAGALYMLADWFGVGGQVQYTDAEVEVFGEDVDAGGIHVHGMAGFTF